MFAVTLIFVARTVRAGGTGTFVAAWVVSESKVKYHSPMAASQLTEKMCVDLDLRIRISWDSESSKVRVETHRRSEA